LGARWSLIWLVLGLLALLAWNEQTWCLKSTQKKSALFFSLFFWVFFLMMMVGVPGYLGCIFFLGQLGG
jgi:hypothetical protein